jgi:hypothetical protein
MQPAVAIIELLYNRSCNTFENFSKLGIFRGFSLKIEAAILMMGWWEALRPILCFKGSPP